MHRYSAQCLEEEPRIIRMLGLISRCAQGHGPVHLLLISTADVGFAWERLVSGFSPSSQDDDWSYPALLRFYFGFLA